MSSTDWTDYRNRSTEAPTTPEQILAPETDEPGIEIDYSGFGSNPGLKEKYLAHNGMPTASSRETDVGGFIPPRTTFFGLEAPEDRQRAFNRFWCLHQGVDDGDYETDEVEKGLQVDPELRDKSIAISAVIDRLNDSERKAVRRMVHRANLLSFNCHYSGLHGATLGAMIVLLYDDLESFKAGEGVCEELDTYIKESSNSLGIPVRSDENDPTKLASFAFRTWDNQ